MLVHIHGFNWTAYTKTVMPAFARWLMNGEEETVQALYQETRCAREEETVPEAMQPLCAWPRAREFVQQLPRGPFARREYQKLCVAEQFLLLSDRYVYRHPPQLYRESEALRTIWGASVEHYCLPWYQPTKQSTEVGELFDQASLQNDFPTARNELLDLLRTAGLNELAQEVRGISSSEGPGEKEQGTNLLQAEATPFLEEEEEPTDGPQGIAIGRLPTPLHIRGWLALQSVRAMVLFEYLVCGRRCMPFGQQEGDPFGSYVGYLTPEEVQQLTFSLREAEPPDAIAAEEDYQHFRQQRQRSGVPFRLIDEVLPAHVPQFLQAAQSASAQGLGLICTIG